MRYQTKGTCASAIDIELNGDRIESVKFTGGCNGNLQGISALVKGMLVDEAIDRLKALNAGSEENTPLAEIIAEAEKITANA